VVVTRDGLVIVDGRDGCLRSAERLAKEKVDAIDCRIDALLLRDPVAMGRVQTANCKLQTVEVGGVGGMGGGDE
jgi:hypothetical protein